MLLWMLLDFENELLANPAELEMFQNVVMFILLMGLCAAVYILNNVCEKQKTRINELENLVDFYYNEDLYK